MRGGCFRINVSRAQIATQCHRLGQAHVCQPARSASTRQLRSGAPRRRLMLQKDEQWVEALVRSWSVEPHASATGKKTGLVRVLWQPATTVRPCTCIFHRRASSMPEGHLHLHKSQRDVVATGVLHDGRSLGGRTGTAQWWRRPCTFRRSGSVDRGQSPGGREPAAGRPEPADAHRLAESGARIIMAPLKVAVVGAGGVGGWFGGRLARLGPDKVDITFIVRPGAHAAALTRTGLRIMEPDSEFTVQPLRLVNSEDLLAGAVPPESFDVVLVCVKGYHLKLVLPIVKKLLRPPGATPTAVLPLLNGMDAPTILADALGSKHVLGGLTLILSEISSPGTILLRKAPPIIIFGELGDTAGELAPTVSRLRSALLEAGNMNVVVPPFDDGGVRRHMWEKFVNICPFSAVCASCRTSVGSIFAVPRGVTLYKTLLSESCAVANAYGVGRPGLFDVAWQMERHSEVGRLPPEASASLSRDIIAGRPSELHDQIGALIRLAGDKGVPTPAFEVVYASLCVVEFVSEQERNTSPVNTGSIAPIYIRAMRRMPWTSRRALVWLASGCAVALVAMPALRRLRGA